MSRLDPTNRAEQLAATMFDLVADRGLEAVTVREVAAAAGVSIGAVQHHFPTKDAMLASAFRHAVGRIRQRLARRSRTGHAATDLHAALTELLPLDEERCREARVQLAFAARAATSAGLQAIQRPLLEQIRAEIETVLRVGAGDDADTRDTAVALLALVDGLALHEVSAPGSLDPRTLERALALGVRAAVADGCAHR